MTDTPIIDRIKRRIRRMFRPHPSGPEPMGHRVEDVATLIATDREAWDAARRAATGGPRVLIATNVTGFQHATLLEAVLAVALTLRGAEVHTIVCDAALPACLRIEPSNIPDPARLLVDEPQVSLCASCMKTGHSHYAPLGLKQWRLSEFITADDRREVDAACAGLDAGQLSAMTTEGGDAVGMHGLAGALRYYARAELPTDPTALEVLRRFVVAAHLTSRAYERLLAQETFEVAVFHHGIYVPQGPTGEVLRRKGVHVVNWNPSYRKSTFIFSHGDTYHHTLMDEPVASWENLPWSEMAERQILEYLASRAEGTRDWIWFHEKPDSDVSAFVKELGLDLDRPIIGMLSNVAWDAQLHYPANAFENMLEWVFKTIAYFEKRPDLQLLLRIHPAEIRGTVPSQQKLLDEINVRFPKLAPNIHIIAPESNVSTYAAMELCDSILIYGTKMGVELTAVGKPVIVAGEAWIRNKGLTADATSEADYFRLLDKLPAGRRMDPAQVARARKYAYHFFFRRMVPLPFIVPAKSKAYGLDIDRLNSLRPAHFAGLDAICDGILTGSSFVYAAETLGLAES